MSWLYQPRWTQFHQWDPVRTRLREDLDAPRVVYENGYIEYFGAPNADCYVGWVARRTSCPDFMPLLTGLALLPGPYRLYFLPNSGMVVHAEPFAPPGFYRSLYEQILCDAHGSPLADRGCNRAGMMSGAQRLVAYEHASAPRVGAILISALGLFLVLLCVGPALLIPDQIYSPTGLFWCGIVLGAIPIGIGMAGLVRAHRACAAAIAGRLVTVEGVVTRDRRWGKSAPVEWNAAIQSIVYRVEQPLWEKLVDGLAYRAYVAPELKYAVGFELL